MPARCTARSGVVTVQTGNVVRQDLTSLVTASGEIKPKNYINIGANARASITRLLVKEGDRVRKGQLLARIENVQPEADVQAQKADAELGRSRFQRQRGRPSRRPTRTSAPCRPPSTRTSPIWTAHEGGISTAPVALQRTPDGQTGFRACANSPTRPSRPPSGRAKSRLIQARAQREQTAAQLASSQKRIAQAQANLVRFNDILQKHNAFAPLDGVVTNLPVRVGETVVPGVQNQPPAPS